MMKRGPVQTQLQLLFGVKARISNFEESENILFELEMF